VRTRRKGGAVVGVVAALLLCAWSALELAGVFSGREISRPEGGQLVASSAREDGAVRPRSRPVLEDEPDRKVRHVSGKAASRRAWESRYRSELVVLVVDEHGNPLEGSFVSVRRCPDIYYEKLCEATSDEAGQTRFIVDVGTYVVSTIGSRDDRIAYVLPGQPTLIKMVEVSPRPLSGVCLEDRTNVPVEGAEVWVSFPGDSRAGRMVARSSADGSFRVSRVSDSSFVSCRKAGVGYSLSYPARVFYGRRQAVRLLASCGSLRGRVVNEQGQPVANARAELGVRIRLSRGSIQPGGQRLFCAPLFGATSDGSGRFVVDTVPEGESVLSVRANGYAPLEISVSCGKQPEELRLVLSVGGVLFGRVYDAANSGVSNASLKVAPKDGARTLAVTVATDGRYAIEGLPQGDYCVVAKKGAAEAREEVSIRNGVRTEWSPRLLETQLLRGKLLSSKAPEARWSMVRQGRDWRRGGALTDAGDFVVAGPRVGRVDIAIATTGGELCAVKRDWPFPTDGIVIVDGEGGRSVELRCSSATFVEGKVRLRYLDMLRTWQEWAVSEVCDRMILRGVLGDGRAEVWHAPTRGKEQMLGLISLEAGGATQVVVRGVARRRYAYVAYASNGSTVRPNAIRVLDRAGKVVESSAKRDSKWPTRIELPSGECCVQCVFAGFAIAQCVVDAASDAEAAKVRSCIYNGASLVGIDLPPLLARGNCRVDVFGTDGWWVGKLDVKSGRAGAGLLVSGKYSLRIACGNKKYLASLKVRGSKGVIFDIRTL